MSFQTAATNTETQNASTTDFLPHRVLELFAGVGGFRHGLNKANVQRGKSGLPPAFEVVWANQWEPGCKHQHAARTYAERWGENVVNRNLFDVLEDTAELARIDSLAPTMLVAGFPCQDYSVAKPISKSEGLSGKKGVLWWGIHQLLQIRMNAGQPIQMILLENVDRLINSPSTCRGRDFAVILSSLTTLGYAVGWQVINSADYGYAQKRKRVFMVAVHQSSKQYRHWQVGKVSPLAMLTRLSPLAQAMPIEPKGPLSTFKLGDSIFKTQTDYLPNAAGKSRFENTGFCINGEVWTIATRAALLPDFTEFVGQTKALTLGNVVQNTVNVPEDFYLSDSSLQRWQYLKGAKSIERIKVNGYKYTFSEGALAFPDTLEKPSRTVITSEGGRTASRTKHVIATVDRRLRRLTPEELEELNGFPRGFTDLPGLTDAKRAFLMGNALVTGVVTRIGMAMMTEGTAN